MSPHLPYRSLVRVTIDGRRTATGGNFAPMANATRGECAKMMSALLYAID